MCTTEKGTELPKGVKAADMHWRSGAKRLTLYYVPNCGGWVVCTLPISGRNNGYADRTYAVTLTKNSVVRVGGGPHVQDVAVVYLDPANEATKYLLNAYESGLGQADTVRTRISSRRAEGQVNRAKGLRSWRWSV